MDASVPSVPSTDPWEAKDGTASKPAKRRGIRKSAIAAASMQMKPSQQEAWSDSESDDEDFAPGDDRDDDVASGSDDDDDDDDDDDGSTTEPVECKKATTTTTTTTTVVLGADEQKKSKKKRPYDEQDKQVSPKPKAVRRNKKDMLREMEIAAYGRAMEDDEDECEGDWIDDDDDEDDDDDDDDEHSSDLDAIVRDDADRLQEALAFKSVVPPTTADPDRALAESGNDLNALMKNYSKERDRAALNRLMESMAHAGFDVNSEAPAIPEEEFERAAAAATKKKNATDGAAHVSDPESDDDDDDDDSANEPEPEESPIHKLIPELIMMLEKDEIDLPEHLAKLCQLVFNRVVMACRIAPSGASIDLGKDLLSIWGGSSASSVFYGRCRRMITFIMNKTRSRFSSHLITTFASAFNGASLAEFVPTKFVVNEAHERHQSDYLCASCSGSVPRHPMPDTIGIEYMPGVELLQHKQVPISRPSGTLHATSPALSRPQGKEDSSKKFLLCAKCAWMVPIMNQLLTACHDVAYLARAWVEEHRDKVNDNSVAPSALGDAFHQDARRQKLCNSIIWAYKMMHAVALT